MAVLRLLLLMICPALLAADDISPVVPASRQADLAWIIPIHGPIDGITLTSIERRLGEAQARGADTVVLELDTPRWGTRIHYSHSASPPRA